MKDLRGLRIKEMEELKEKGVIQEGHIIEKDGKSEIDEEQLYVVFFNNSDEKDKAWEIVYNQRMKNV